MDDDLVPFLNVNDLPPVPAGAKRAFVELRGLWFYEDIYPTVFDNFRVG